MSRQSDLVELTRKTAQALSSGANKNWVINGMFNVAQRGTSQTASGYNSVDRWYLYSSGGTYSQETSAPPEGFSHYLKCTGATGSVIFAQAIELPATGNAGVFYNGQTITLSYYAKSTVAGDALYNPLSFRNSQTSTTNLVQIDNDSSDNNVLTTSWARYSKTYTIGVSADANNTCLVVQPRTSGAPSGDISITGVQLEVGETANSFSHRSYDEELDMCKRYFQVVAPTGGNKWITNSHGYSSSQIEGLLRFEKPMRATPSFVQSSGSNYFAFKDNGSYIYANSLSSYLPSNYGVLLYKSALSGVNTSSGYRMYTNDANAYFYLNAEL